MFLIYAFEKAESPIAVTGTFLLDFESIFIYSGIKYVSYSRDVLVVVTYPVHIASPFTTSNFKFSYVSSVKLISLAINNKDKNNVENVMESNLTQMMEVAKDYFKEDKLPKQVGKSTKVDLETLIKDKKISALKDSKGKECDLNESFIKATRLDKEYQIKAYLVCNKETDYLNELLLSHAAKCLFIFL